MPKKSKIDDRLVWLGFFSIAFFALVARGLSSVEFRLSMFEMMLTILSSFLFAVVLMIWGVVIPLARKLGKKNIKKIFSL